MEQLKKIENEITKFIMFENKSNTCWVNSALSLLVLNSTVKKIASCEPASVISDVIISYDKVLSIVNDPDMDEERKKEEARKILNNIQSTVLGFLQPILNFKAGEPDSAFCALLNILLKDPYIKEETSLSWHYDKKCNDCGKHTTSGVCKKPVITLSEVYSFDPICPTSTFMCSCKKKQELKVIYNVLPPCLFFHFERGIGNNNGLPFFFSIRERKYYLTGIIIYVHGKTSDLNHFVTLVRDPVTQKWLDCNDLNSDIISFTNEQPEFTSKEIYILSYESFDSKGKINIDVTNYVPEENEAGNIECIDLSEDLMDVGGPCKNNSENNVSTAGDGMDSIEKSVNDLLLQDTAKRQKPLSGCFEKKIIPSKSESITKNNSENATVIKASVVSHESSEFQNKDHSENISEMANKSSSKSTSPDKNSAVKQSSCHNRGLVLNEAKNENLVAQKDGKEQLNEKESHAKFKRCPESQVPKISAKESTLSMKDRPNTVPSKVPKLNAQRDVKDLGRVLKKMRMKQMCMERDFSQHTHANNTEVAADGNESREASGNMQKSDKRLNRAQRNDSAEHQHLTGNESGEKVHQAKSKAQKKRKMNGKESQGDELEKEVSEATAENQKRKEKDPEVHAIIQDVVKETINSFLFFLCKKHDNL